MTGALAVGFLLGVGVMLLREHYADRRHRETVALLRRRVLDDAAASRPPAPVFELHKTKLYDREAHSHAVSRERREG